MKALKWGRERLWAAGVEGFSLDALVLLCYGTGKSKEWLFSHDYALSETEMDVYGGALDRRASGVPAAYIVRGREFMGLPFYVDESVLIPRGDTEILVERLIEAARGIIRPKILDLCTGSGCIAVSAAYYLEEASVTGVDISPEATAIAQVNAKTLGVSGRCAFHTGNLFEIFENSVQIGGLFDIIVANPPYISGAEMEGLPDTVKREPRLALYGGESGLEFYVEIAREARRYLRNGGALLFEIGCKQGGAVVEIMNKNGYTNINIYNDLAGLDRVVKGEYRCLTG